MASPEPRFARIAATIGDPTRARMLSALMGGGFLAAGELAKAAGVTAQTASSHIAKLVDSELVVARTQGRHRYFRLADAEIAHALEALSLVAERSTVADKWAHGPYKSLKAARTCYGHLAGELGVQLFEGLLARGWLRRAKDSRAVSITHSGTQALSRWLGPAPT
jgi:DNA-binding transcriptional ArsR family regulator